MPPPKLMRGQIMPKSQYADMYGVRTPIDRIKTIKESESFLNQNLDYNAQVKKNTMLQREHASSKIGSINMKFPEAMQYRIDK